MQRSSEANELFRSSKGVSARKHTPLVLQNRSIEREESERTQLVWIDTSRFRKVDRTERINSTFSSFPQTLLDMSLDSDTQGDRDVEL